jgi:transcriptional regulator with XRE-family HTH domain
MSTTAHVPRVPEWRDIDPAAVGRRIKEARIEAGLSQRQLAFPGCSAAYISRLEAGDRTPSGHLLEEMARRLGTTRAYLETGERLVPIHVDEGLLRRAVETERAAIAAFNNAKSDEDAAAAARLAFEASEARDALYETMWDLMVAACYKAVAGGREDA